MNAYLSEAQRLHAEGASIIDVPLGSKEPDRKAWQLQRLTAEQLAERFSEPRNVSILCGAPSKGLTDVDLDIDEAVAVAPALLPRTGRIGGRTKRPHSHRWYIVDQPPAKASTQFIDPVLKAQGASDDRAMILEWRSTKGHTVVFGQHPDGDTYEWTSDGPPARISARELDRCVRWVAVAALAARYWPGRGVRHQAALAWSGFLLNCGTPPDVLEDMLSAIAAAAGDDEAEDRVTAARTTADRKRAGEPYTGGTHLAELLGEHGGLIVERVQKWLLPRAVHRDAEPEEPDAAEEPPAYDATPCTLGDVIEAFQRWMYLPDPGMVEVSLAAYAANEMDGDPVRILMVAPPSSGKTAVLSAMQRLPRTFMSGTITEAGLLSGSPKREHGKGAKGGLLHQIGAHGHLLLKDFTSVISMNRDGRAAVLAALREIYDGAYTRHVGSDGGRELHWAGKIGLLAGVTPAIDTAHGVMAAMGERFIMYRSPKIDTDALAERALWQTGDEGDMREELAAAVAGLFAGLELPERAATLDDFTRTRIVTLASLAARARSHVERDPIKREIELVPEPEAPGRLAKAIAGLYNGMAVIGVAEERRWRLLTKIAFDCIPAVRRRVILTLARADGWLNTTQVATLIRYPTISARRALEDLAAHGVVTRAAGGKGKADTWTLSPWAAQRYTAIHGFAASDDGTFSEMSDGIGSEAPDGAAWVGGEGGDTSSYTMEDDISEKVSGDDGRETVCWSCKQPLTSDGDEECDRCGGLLCACGACFCREEGSKPAANRCQACGGALGDSSCEDCGEPIALSDQVYDLARRVNFCQVGVGRDVVGAGGDVWLEWVRAAPPGRLEQAHDLLQRMVDARGNGT